MVLLQETGQFDDVEILSAMGSPLNSDQMPTGHNPLGKIPALVRNDGSALFDSRVICRFLDDRAGGKLYPAAPRLYETLTLESLADGIVDAAILIVYEMRLRPPEKAMDPWIDGQWAKVSRALDALEERWMSHLNGRFDMGQIALGCALSYLDFRLGDKNWRAQRPHLAEWEKAFSARESMVSTVPVG